MTQCTEYVQVVEYIYIQFYTLENDTKQLIMGVYLVSVHVFWYLRFEKRHWFLQPEKYYA